MKKELKDWIINIKKLNFKLSDLRLAIDNIDSRYYEQIPGIGFEEKLLFVYNYTDEFKLNIKEKIKINLLIADDSSSLEYIEYLNKIFDITVIKHTERMKNNVDLILFTGGEDVNPSYYNEKKGVYTSCNYERDEKEVEIFNEYRSTPKIAICRGAQLNTVLAGGKLIQHVDGHDKDHNIFIENYGTYKMTSSHHQMMNPFKMTKDGYELIAYSEYFQSKTYLNGDSEIIKRTKEFLEPEIIYYPYTKALCIQGHPEWRHCDSNTSNICLNLIQKYLLNNNIEKLKPIGNYFVDEQLLINNLKNNDIGLNDIILDYLDYKVENFDYYNTTFIPNKYDCEKINITAEIENDEN